ncbi:hypothetical protein Tco_0974932, partial [Tanacetum coccineum]
MELKTSSSFKTTGLLQPWQTLCKIFSKFLTTRVTGWDQPPLQIMQMMYCFINNIHVDYAELLWEGIYYSLHHLTTSIPYPRFTKIIIGHYMTNFPEILRTHRTPSAPRSPNPKKDAGESSIPKRSIVIHFRIPQRRSTRLTPPAPVPTVDKAEEIILQDTLQVSLAEHQSRIEQEARENVELVNEHLASEEIEKIVEEQENIVDDSSPPRNDDPNILGPRLEPRSDKESPEVEVIKDAEVEIPNDVIPVNVNDDEVDEITDEVYELKRREKGNIVEESKSTTSPITIRSPKIHTNLELQDRYRYLFAHLKKRVMSRESFDKLANHLQEVITEALPTMVNKHIKEQVKKQVPEQVKERGRIQAEISSQVQQAIDTNIPSLVDASVRSYMSGHILHVHPTQPQVSYVLEQQYQLTPTILLRDQDNSHDDAHPEGENSAKRQKTSEYESHVIGESSGQGNDSEPGPSSSGNQEQVDDYDFWTESYATND